MEFKVGDKIKMIAWYGSHIVVINRVTKTQAIADVFDNDGKIRYRYKFSKYYDIWDEGTMRINVHPIPRVNYNTTDYYLI